MHPIARWLLFLANFLLVLYAIVQVAGRLLMPWLSSAENELNKLLADQHIRIEGIEGRWSLLNPIVSARRVVLPAGELVDVTVQPDLIESALRSAPVLRRAAVSDGHIALARDESGWWLAGMKRGKGSSFDLSTLLFESDELSGAVTITLLGQKPESMRIVVQAINRGGRSEVAADITRPDAPTAIASVRFDRARGIPLLRPPGHQGTVVIKDFLVPRLLTGEGEIRIADVEGVWKVKDGSGRGELNVGEIGARIGDSLPFTLSSAFHVWSSGWDWGVNGDLRFSAAGGEAVIRDVVAWQTDSRIDVRIDHMDAGEVLGLAKTVAAPVEKANRWLVGLDAKGQLRNAWAFVRLDGASGAEDDPGWRFGYGSQILEGRTLAFNGVPAAEGADAEVIGYERGFRVSLDGDALRVGFHDLFPTTWDAHDATGSVHVFFRPGYSGIRGTEMKATTGTVLAHGEFAVTNPQLLARKAVVLLAEADGASFEDARTFVPRTLEPRLHEWLTTAPQQGQLSGIRFAFQGQNKAPGLENARRVEIRTTLANLLLAYHADWPLLENVSGDLAVRGNDVTFAATSGQSSGLDLQGSSVAVVKRGGEARIDLVSRGDAAAYLDFIRHSPLLDRMKFVRPEWMLLGPMNVDGALTVPLRGETEAVQTTASLTGELRGLQALLPELRLSFSDIAGPFAFETPHALSSPHLAGSLWGEPVEMSIEPVGEHVWVKAKGEMTTERALLVATLDDPGFIQGRFVYEAEAGIAAATDATTEIMLRSNLAGVALDLPEGLSKDLEDDTPSMLGLQFLDEYVVLSFQYRDVLGWLHMADAPIRGAIGIGVQPPVIDLADSFVRVSGQVHHMHLEEWTKLFAESDARKETESAGVETLSRPARVVINDLRVNKAWVGDLAFKDLLLDADTTPDRTKFDFSAEALEGSVELAGDQPIVMNIEHVSLPPAPKPPEVPDTPEVLRKKLGPAPDDDPLSESLIASLPPMDVDIKRVWRGEEDFGKWRFELRKPEEEALVIQQLDAEIKGLRITSKEGVRWTAGDDLTAFKGAVDMNNLAEVLPQWRYAPTVASETASIQADVRWPGSPLNLSLAGIAGQLSLSAKNGRFLEVESGSGAMRIMSLFSFSAILKRLNFNFSDVIGRGVGFETLQTKIDLADGMLTFTEPMEVKSTSSDFRLGGKVNLHTGELANELVMTLPVSKNLPWYGVYIALANPLVGLGVIVGERLLRKPLEQFSSAKYQVRGTLAEPEVKFVGLFDDELTAPALPAKQRSSDEAVAEDQVVDSAKDAMKFLEKETSETTAPKTEVEAEVESEVEADAAGTMLEQE